MRFLTKVQDCGTKANMFKAATANLINKFNVQKNVLYFLIEMGLRRASEAFMGEGYIPTHVLTEIHTSEVYQSLNLRAQVVDAIMATDSAAAIQLIDTYYPELLKKNPIIHMKLLLLELGVLIKSRDTTRAIAFCQGPISSLFVSYPECISELQKYTLLMIAPDPFSARNSHLLCQARLNIVARDVSHDIISFYQPDYVFHEIMDLMRLHSYSKLYGDTSYDSNGEAETGV
uniref:Glucose-induced degradation protein 8 homolog (Trinotate prediction) n=1 Tax=Myxobolus squamalis TaxID=59785 RepID=A0A6B2G1C2_MYXSQ